jgi:class 3 adenylate cyclase
MRDTRQWGVVVDSHWRIEYATDELRLVNSGGVELAPYPLGVHLFGSEAVSRFLGWRLGMNKPEFVREAFAAVGSLVLADTHGGHDGLRELVDPMLHDLIDGLAPADPAALSGEIGATGPTGARAATPAMAWRIRDAAGRLAGTAFVFKPAAGMATLGMLATMGDVEHLERMLRVSMAGRRPAAVLFVDLEASAPLARRLSTAGFFALGRRLVRAADRCVVDAGGLVGRHVGDGVAAYFLAEIAGSESAAARACIAAARTLRTSIREVARRSALQPEDITLRFGLHWGSTLYVGNITTPGRSEVTALGDAANEAARIEACATGGLALASKELLERLDTDDAAALDLDPDHVTYTTLGDLPNATDKARRDAPAIAVCEI